MAGTSLPSQEETFRVFAPRADRANPGPLILRFSTDGAMPIGGDRHQYEDVERAQNDGHRGHRKGFATVNGDTDVKLVAAPLVRNLILGPDIRGFT